MGRQSQRIESSKDGRVQGKRKGSRATFAACTRERQRFASSPRLFLSLSSLSSPGRSMMIGSRVLDSREGGRFPLLRLSVLLGEQELLTSLFSLPLPLSRACLSRLSQYHQYQVVGRHMPTES